MSILIDTLERQCTSQPAVDASYRYLRFISMIYLTVLLAATMVAYRLIMIGPMIQPGSTAIYVSSFFIANIIAEVYGEQPSKKLIAETLICGYVFAILISLVNALPSPPYFHHKKAYDIVFSHVLRFTNAGVIGFLSSSWLNMMLITKWKHQMNGRLFWVRSLLASSFSELFATFLAGFITFFGMLPSKHIIMLMAHALFFKLSFGFVAVWPTSFVASLLKQKEQSG